MATKGRKRIQNAPFSNMSGLETSSSILQTLGLKPLSSPSNKRPRSHAQCVRREMDEGKRSEPKNPQFFIQHKQILNSDFFSTLPDEMVLRILSALPKRSLASVAQVSKKFARLVEDESLWEAVDGHAKVLDPKSMEVIFHRNPVFLRLARITLLTPTALPPLPPTPNLTHLDLSMSLVPPCVISAILCVAPNLQKISLEHLTLDEAVFRAFKSKNIDTLNLTLCSGVQHQLLSNLLRTSARLKTLNLGCIKPEWDSNAISQVINSLPKQITQLNLAGLRTNMNDKHTSDLVRRLPSLIDLDLSDNQELTSSSIRELTTLKTLQHLSLSRCYSIDPASYADLAAIKSLRFLELFSLFKESSIKSLAAGLGGNIQINQFPFSAVARPTVGNKRSSIWGVHVRR